MRSTAEWFAAVFVQAIVLWVPPSFIAVGLYEIAGLDGIAGFAIFILQFAILFKINGLLLGRFAPSLLLTDPAREQFGTDGGDDA